MNQNDNIAVRVTNLSKQFDIFDKPSDRLKEVLSFGRKKYSQTFTALKDINLSIRKGEFVGIVGCNGAGKSTLLKILSGQISHSSGNIEIDGTVSLLQLGIGFNRELTGIDNIKFAVRLLGHDEEYIDDIIEKVVDFADIGEFIHHPVKTYSSGMYSRLSFAVGINIDPDILIVDEVLSVGDMRFSAKCLRKMHEFKEQGKTVLLVHHDVTKIAVFCDRALWIHNGLLREIGNAKDIAERYRDFMVVGSVPEVKEKKSEDASVPDQSHDSRNVNGEPEKREDGVSDSVFLSKPALDSAGQCGLGDTTIKGVKASTKENEQETSPDEANGTQWVSLDEYPTVQTGSVKITHFAIARKNGKSSAAFFDRNEKIQLHLKAVSSIDVDDVSIGWIILDKNGLIACHSNSQFCGTEGLTLKSGNEYLCTFDMTIPPVRNGEYIFSLGVKKGDNVIFKVNDTFPFVVCTNDLNSNQGGYIIVDDAHFACTPMEFHLQGDQKDNKRINS